MTLYPIESYCYSICNQQELEDCTQGSKQHGATSRRIINILPPGIQEEEYPDKVLGLHPLLVKKVLAKKKKEKEKKKVLCLDKSSLCLGGLGF